MTSSFFQFVDMGLCLWGDFCLGCGLTNLGLFVGILVRLLLQIQDDVFLF